MSLLARLFRKIDDNLSHTDRHLAVAVPAPRSVSPDEVIRQPLHTFECCACCVWGNYTCTAVHRDRCDMHQRTGA